MHNTNLTLESVKYEEFKRKISIYKESQLITPELNTSVDFIYPESTTVHHLELDSLSSGPYPNELGFKEYKGKIYIEHIEELTSLEGRPRLVRNRVYDLMKEYKRRFPVMREMKDYKRRMGDRKILLVINYDFLTEGYTYTTSKYTQYYLWKNILSTQVDKIQELARFDGRQHFFRFELPDRIPTKKLLELGRKDVRHMSEEILSIFSKPKYMFLYHLWEWFGDKRKDSILSKIDPLTQKRINILFQGKDKIINLNLGDVNNWLENDEEEGVVGNPDLQRKFLSFITKMHESINETLDEEEPLAEKPENQDQEEDEITDILNMSEELVEDFEIVDRSTPAELLNNEVNELLKAGVINSGKAQGLLTLLENQKKLPNPLGGGTLEEAINFTEEELKIDPKDSRIIPERLESMLADKGAAYSSIDVLDDKIKKGIYEKNILAMTVNAFNNSGFIVMGTEAEEVEEYGNHYKVLKIKVKPLDGDVSTVSIKYPILDEDGNYTAENVKYRLKLQRRDKPIRKTFPHEVALTSRSIKLFVNRSQAVKFNLNKWVLSQVGTACLDKERGVKHHQLADVFDASVKTPRMYGILARRFSNIEVKGYKLFFDINTLKDNINPKDLDNFDKTYKDYSQLVPLGYKGNDFIMLDANGIIHNQEGPITSIFELFNLEYEKMPIEIAEISIYGKTLPIGIMLGYFYGITNLYKLLNVQPRKMVRGKRIDLQENEFSLTFADEVHIFNKYTNPKATLILASLTKYNKELVSYPIASFNDKDVFQNILEESGFRSGFVREMDHVRNTFMDANTKYLLKQMNEPLIFDLLLVRACELLTTEYHPRETQRDVQIDESYTRVGGIIYDEITKATRKYKSRKIGSKDKLEINPLSAWMTILTDSSKIQVEESNPLRAIKERSLATFTGVGGRSELSMVKRTRVFGKEDLGITSEASPDSSKTGLNFNLSVNPNLTSVFGEGVPLDKKNLSATKVMSVAANNAPFADTDIIQRIGFIDIQMDHAVYTEGSVVCPVSTTYERVIAHRTSSLFANSAKKDGKVIAKDKTKLTIQFKDGEKKSYKIGRTFGLVTGTVVPHELVTEFEVGDKVQEGDIITYHPKFFSPNPFHKKQVEWKMGVIANTMFIERANTFEDSCEISQNMAKKLTTSFTYVIDVSLSFKDNLEFLVKLGDKLEPDTVICTISDEVGANKDVYGEVSRETLDILGRGVKKSDISGYIEKIEVLYNGEKEDMNPVLRKLADDSDRVIKQERIADNKKPLTGKVNPKLRVGRDVLQQDRCLIKIYVVKDYAAIEGDKVVFCNQMKSIISNILMGENATEDGEDVDAVFSFWSTAKRTVDSCMNIGITTAILQRMSKKAAEFYFSKK